MTLANKKLTKHPPFQYWDIDTPTSQTALMPFRNSNTMQLNQLRKEQVARDSSAMSTLIEKVKYLCRTGRPASLTLYPPVTFLEGLCLSNKLP